MLAYIGLGANVPSVAGPPEETLRAAAARLALLGEVLRCSSLYRTAPVGFTNQPAFTNAVVALETGIVPGELLAALLGIEAEFGRDRSAGLVNGPRTLDLDILMMADLCIQEAGLEIPHPRMAERAFVLIPLAEIAPEAIEPASRTTITTMLETLRARGDSGNDAVVRIADARWCAGAARVLPAADGGAGSD